MTAKRIITLVVGILALAVTAWKGPVAWHLVATAVGSVVAAVALGYGTLKVIPAKDEEYVKDLEDALASTNASAEAVTAGPSRARYLRRKAS